jgi:BirA family biotin operon repressor/biotin-[acetyl-CoA-carboxylase] ligase
LPLRAGVGLAQAAASLLGVPCQLKWPNDLLVDERKLGGVLIESVTLASGGALAAIGFGVNYAPSPEVTAAGGIDLLSLNPGAQPMARCARVLLDGVGTWLDPALSLDRVVRAARQITAHRPGRRVSFRVGDEVVEGEFFGLDESGLLLLKVAGTLRRFSAGEIIES